MITCARAAGWVLAIGTVCALGCTDGLFAPGAAPRGRAQLVMSSTAVSDSALFESVDAMHVGITSRTTGILLDSTLAFRSAGAETHVHLAVQLQSSQEAVVVNVELRVAGLTAFQGLGSGTLKRGENTVVPITLTLVPAMTVVSRR